MEPHLRVIAFVLTIIAMGVSIHYQTVLLQLTTYCESSSWSNNTPRGTYFPSAKHSSLTVELLATGTTSGNCTSIFGSYSPITPGVPKTKWEFMSHNFIHLKAWKCHVKKQSTPMVDNVLCMTTQRLKKKKAFHIWRQTWSIFRKFRARHPTGRDRQLQVSRATVGWILDVSEKWSTVAIRFLKFWGFISPVQKMDSMPESCQKGHLSSHFFFFFCTDYFWPWAFHVHRLLTFTFSTRKSQKMSISST